MTLNPTTVDSMCVMPDSFCLGNTSKNTTNASEPAASPCEETSTMSGDRSAVAGKQHWESAMPAATPTGVTTANSAEHATTAVFRAPDQASSWPRQYATISLFAASAANARHTPPGPGGRIPAENPRNVSCDDSASTATNRLQWNDPGRRLAGDVRGSAVAAAHLPVHRLVDGERREEPDAEYQVAEVVGVGQPAGRLEPAHRLPDVRLQVDERGE
ncbi:hypothetical protein AGLY_012123 [Aphis glycines]|uniref:Uncharacterized protein n=1 Tax=Aphis glycines TaxID=307491 RepID=A0A6G0TA37_APHGL|nr:hypothetical protein AGLY_012123 [Aphis glycines]